MIKKISSISLVLLITATIGYVYYNQSTPNQSTSKQTTSSQTTPNQPASSQTTSIQPTSKITELEALIPSDKVDVFFNARFDSTFEELEKYSAVILIGESLGENNKSSNLHVPVEGSSIKIYDIIKGFDFKVDEWIKGSGPNLAFLAKNVQPAYA